MNAIAKSVGRGTNGDHGFQRGWPQKGGLQRVNAAPGFAHHAHRPRTPVLGGQPFDHLTGVSQFLKGEFIGQNPGRLARFAQINPHKGIAMPGHDRVQRFIPRGGAVSLAERDYSKMAGTGFLAASNGLQMRDDSLQSSDITMATSG